MVVKYFERMPTHAGYTEREHFKDGSWVLINNPSIHELQDLSEQFNVSLTQLQHVRDREELPRLEYTDDGTYIFLRHTYTSSTGERVTAPLLLVLKSECLLVILPHPFATELSLLHATHTLRGTSLQIITHVLDQYRVFLDEITHRIKELRRSLHTHEISNQDLAYFVTLEEELNDFSSSLEPLNAIFQRLVLAHQFPLTPTENETLGDLILKNQQLISTAINHLRSIESIRNAHTTIATNNLNRIIKILTIATVLLNVPSVIFFALGMNIFIPYHTSPWTLPVVVLGAFIITVVVFVVARRKKIF